MRHAWWMVVLALLMLSLASFSCKEESPTAPGAAVPSPASRPPGDFGRSTSIVVHVNPKVDQGTTEGIQMGSVKEAVSVKLEGQPPVLTDAAGIAEIRDVPVQENLPVYINDQPVLLDVKGALDQYDLIVSYHDNRAELVVDPIRHEYRTNIKGAGNYAQLTARINENDLNILLDSVIYRGSVEVRGNNISIIGQWNPEDGPTSVIDGDLVVLGNNIQILDVVILGNLIIRGNNVCASYSEFNSVSVENDNVVILRNNVRTIASVSGDRVYLFGNQHVP
jgi:hypothetical protein